MMIHVPDMSSCVASLRALVMHVDIRIFPGDIHYFNPLGMVSGLDTPHEMKFSRVVSHNKRRPPPAFHKVEKHLRVDAKHRQHTSPRTNVVTHVSPRNICGPSRDRRQFVHFSAKNVEIALKVLTLRIRKCSSPRSCSRMHTLTKYYQLAIANALDTSEEVPVFGRAVTRIVLKQSFRRSDDEHTGPRTNVFEHAALGKYFELVGGSTKTIVPFKLCRSDRPTNEYS